MIKKKKIIKDPQRLKHKVRFDIELFQDPKNNEIKLLIVFIQKGGIADGKLLLGDIIKSINGIAVNNKEIELVVGFGSHIVEIGDLYDLKNKLDNLFIFYRDALPAMGWDRYKKINLKYKNQIVCTKKQVAYGTK